MNPARTMPVTTSAPTIQLAYLSPERDRPKRSDENASPASAVAMPARERVNSRQRRISAAHMKMITRCDIASGSNAKAAGRNLRRP